MAIIKNLKAQNVPPPSRPRAVLSKGQPQRGRKKETREPFPGTESAPGEHPNLLPSPARRKVSSGRGEGRGRGGEGSPRRGAGFCRAPGRGQRKADEAPGPVPTPRLSGRLPPAAAHLPPDRPPTAATGHPSSAPIAAALAARSFSARPPPPQEPPDPPPLLFGEEAATMLLSPPQTPTGGCRARPERRRRRGRAAAAAGRGRPRAAAPAAGGRGGGGGRGVSGGSMCSAVPGRRWPAARQRRLRRLGLCR